GGIYDLKKELGGSYKLRIGLSYGSLYLEQVKGREYSEWTTIGESVHLAKRLCDWDKLKQLTEQGICGAFGILLKDIESINQFTSILGFITGPASRMTHKVTDESVSNLKGISPAKCAILLPKS
ncbi:MAG TPA: hypothetical protein DCE80_12685, partial [Ignavibacteriales bacterium]|nr:hypothetical protein [Ignavibacteriales bacterium]